MSNELAIRVERLGKVYRIGGKQERYKTLRESLSQAAGAPLRRIRKALHRRNGQEANGTDTFWALRDISFEVKCGEVVGIIGRNGAGKSTLLKILSRITEPSEGFAEIHGRVGSLLEVGTGFHQELTGRENIYLNGAILGMRRAEIDSKFDEIVAFAEVERFIDTAVKHYSSGMYLRLAFAVAAHLDPEILLVDEVLAVGDAQFQRKCLGKMEDVAGMGRTVLFVSHDMNNVSKLCGKGILLNAGHVEAAGEISSVIIRYMTSNATSRDGHADLTTRGDRSGTGVARFRSVELLDENDTHATTFEFGRPLSIRTVVDVREYVGSPQVSFLVLTSEGLPIHELTNWNESCVWTGDVGAHSLQATIKRLLLYPGSYAVDLWLGEGSQRVDYIKGAITFEVVQTPATDVERPLRRSNGLVFQTSEWRYERETPAETR